MTTPAPAISNLRRRRLVWGILLLGLSTLLLGTRSAQAATQTFLFTGAEQTFKVPGGVTSVHVVAIGGAGGAATDSSGGVAAEVSGDLTGLTPGQTLYVEVGGRGEDAGDGGVGGFNGGGNGAGGGGGASDVRTTPLASGLLTDKRLIVAAGGGGGGGSGPLGLGANGGAAGAPGDASELYGGGGAGTSTEGGLGAEGCVGATGGNGERGFGGEGSNAGSLSGPGGGGGGGYFGGGGGAGSCEFGSSGGGGGSSLLPPLGLQSLASLATEPKIEVTYTLVPPSIELISPTEGATYVQGQAVNAVYFCIPPEGTSVSTCAGPAANGSPLDTAALGEHTFKVFAEDSDGATEAESVKYTVVAPPVKPKEPELIVDPAQRPPLPDTTIDSHPKETIKTTKKKATVRFSFSSTVVGAGFECKLDKGSFELCSSPKTYKAKLGKHKFSVQAVSAGGVDPSAATFTFKVKKKPKKQ